MIDQRIGKIKVRRGTDSQRVTNTFEEGEVIYSVDKKRIFVGDDVTLGGVPVSNRNYIVNSLGVPPIFPDGVLEGDIIHDKSNSKTYIVNSNNGTLELLLLADGNQSSNLKTQISAIYTKLYTLTGCLTPPPPPPPPPSKLNWVVQPSNFSINVGDSVTFSSSAVGTGSITYQWRRKDGLVINTSNIFQKSFTINSAGIPDIATYYCIASNSVDSISSKDAVLNVVPVPVPIVERRWNSVAMSSDGTKQTAVVLGGQIYISTDSGNTWTAKESDRSWTSVAMSSDGTKQTAVAYFGQIYISSDSGNTWTPKESDRNWFSVAMSSDGTKQTAVAGGGAGAGQIYISTDSGNTWTAKESYRSWWSVAMSSDGTKQTSVANAGQIYISTDSGNTWTAKESYRSWWSVAMSSDGTKQTSVDGAGQIYISTDSGNTWTAKESNRKWRSVAMSSDGTKQTAVVYVGQIYISTDSGNTWTAKESNRQWSSVAMSSDGTKQTAVAYGGQIYISTDSGNTWTAKF